MGTEATVTQADRRALAELGYRVVDATNDHVKSGWLAIPPGESSYVGISASIDDAWAWCQSHRTAASQASDAGALAAELRPLWEAVTAGDLSTAERHTESELVECPMCHEGSIEAADYCNIDGKALGVQFYGIGPEHGAHERLWTAVIANFPTILATLTAPPTSDAGEEMPAELLDRAQSNWARFFNPENSDFDDECGHLNHTGVPLAVADGLREVLNWMAGTVATSDPRHILSIRRAVASPPTSGEEMRLREALERISKLTPFSANAATAEDFAATVHAIADAALTKGADRHD